MSLISVSGKYHEQKINTKQGLASQKRNMEQQVLFIDITFDYIIHFQYNIESTIQ